MTKVANNLEHWAIEYSYALRQLRSQSQVADSPSDLQCQLDQIFANGTCTGICIDERATYQVFAGFLLSGRSYGCSCRDSKSKSPCLHSRAFLNFLLDEIDDSVSTLYQAIISSTFTPGEPDYRSLEPGVYELQLEAFDQLVAKRRPRVIDIVDDFVEPASAEVLRVA
jgi:hypothetical protein